MKLYLAHASNYDYMSELYLPLKESLSKDNDIFFPHDEKNSSQNSRDIIPTCDTIIAEVSYPSTGQGIELGWADMNNIPIICFYLRGSKPSSALQFISTKMFEYQSVEDMVQTLRLEISRI